MSSQKTRLLIGVVAVAVLLGGFALSRTYTEKKETQQQIQENEKRLYRFLQDYNSRGVLKKIAGIY